MEKLIEGIEPIPVEPEIKFIQDTDVKNVGTLIVTLNGVAYAKRVDTNIEAEIDLFVSELKGKVVIVEHSQAEIDAVVAKVATKLTGVIK